MKIFLNTISIFALAFMVFFNSCKKDETVSPGGKAINNFNQTGETLKTLSGFVVDENNVPLAGVTVTAHGQVFTTGNTGYFIFEDLAIPNNRYILRFSLNGYFSVTRSDALITDSKPIQVKVGMLPITTNATTDTVSFPSSTGGTLVVGTLINMEFPPDVYMYESGLPYVGRVHIAATYMDPTDVNYNIRTHGGDQVGRYEGESEEYLLRAFVGANIMLSDNNGQKLQLNPNMPSSVAFSLEIPASLRQVCPNDIDIWTFDETFGLRGSTTTNSTTASKEGVTVSGMVGHFSYISCEIAYTSDATVMGYVRNNNGDPIAGVTVKVGESFAVTDINGFYSRQVIAGVPINVSIVPDYLGQIIAPINVTPYGNTAVDITVMAEQTFNGHLVDCNGNPVAGNVVITWGGSASSSTYTNNGSFSVEIPTGTGFVDIYAYGNGTDVYLPFLNSGVDQEVVLCPPSPTGPNLISLNGGANMFATVISAFDSKHGYIFTSGPETVIELMNSSLTFYIYAGGTTAGTYDVTGSAYISYDNNPPQPAWAPLFQNASVTINNYGPVGGLLEGTFTGLTEDGTQVNIQFSVNRTPDQ